MDALASARHAHGRPAIWAALRSLGGGTVAEISKASGAPKRTISSFLQALIFAGVIRRADGAGPQGGARYEATGPLPVELPAIRPDGTVAPENGRARMWRTMKMLRTFSARDLAVAASLPGAPVQLDDARDYTATLARAGYLAVLKPGTPKGGLAVYRLAKNTGPQPPQIQRKATLFDPNLGQVVWIEGQRA